MRHANTCGKSRRAFLTAGRGGSAGNGWLFLGALTPAREHDACGLNAVCCAPTNIWHTVILATVILLRPIPPAISDTLKPNGDCRPG